MKTTVTDILKEVQQYERLKAAGKACSKSSVQPVTCIVLNVVTHSGVVTHQCGLREGHEEKSCKCQCGYSWLSW